MLYQDRDQENAKIEAERLYNRLEDYVEEKKLYECEDGTQFVSTQAAQLYAAYLHCGEDKETFTALLRYMEWAECWN